MSRRLIGIAVTAVVLLGMAAIVSFMSWLGGGLKSFTGPVRVIHLGPRGGSAEMVALARLARELPSHPETRCFELRWTDSWLLGWSAEHQWVIEYDRREQALAEYHLLTGPLEQWRPVPERLVSSLASTGFDDQLLVASGARSGLP